MRDSLCSLENLKETISFDEEFILKDENTIISLQKDIKKGVQRFPKKNEDIIYSKRVGILSEIHELIRAKYSIGSECTEVFDIYAKSIPIIKEIGCQKIGFVNFIQFLSLGILLEVEIEKIAVLIECADSQKMDGKLIDYLAHACGIDRDYCSSGFGKDEPYKELEEIIRSACEDKDEAAIKLEKYMKEDWLKGHRDYDWHTAHKKPGYVGFWSFETAALAKVLQLDDSRLKENNHYPYDLAHYKNSMNFKVEPLAEAEKIVCAQEQLAECRILSNPELEQFIPCQFHQYVNQLIMDYERLEDYKFWEKYKLDNIWFTIEDYTIENGQTDLLGTIIVNKLVEKGLILQIDYKEELADYKDNIKNYWDNQKTRLVKFDLENDQKYFAYVPEEMNAQNFYGVKIYDI